MNRLYTQCWMPPVPPLHISTINVGLYWRERPRHQRQRRRHKINLMRMRVNMRISLLNSRLTQINLFNLADFFLFCFVGCCFCCSISLSCPSGKRFSPSIRIPVILAVSCIIAPNITSFFVMFAHNFQRQSTCSCVMYVCVRYTLRMCVCVWASVFILF